MATHLPQHRAANSADIPDKLYFRIGEVAQLCGVPSYVLRFWETEFPQLRPNKSGTGQRLYRKRDVEMALRIKQLVHEEGYTLAGARQVLHDNARKKTEPRESQSKPQTPVVEPAPPVQAPPEVEQRLPLSAVLGEVREEIHAVLAMLKSPVSVTLPVTVKAEPLAQEEAEPQPTLFES